MRPISKELSAQHAKQVHTDLLDMTFCMVQALWPAQECEQLEEDGSSSRQLWLAVSTEHICNAPDLSADASSSCAVRQRACMSQQ